MYSVLSPSSLVRDCPQGIAEYLYCNSTMYVTFSRSFFSHRWQALSDFSERHKGHVARLWAEAQELVSDMGVVQGEYYRAKDAYEQACIQATRLIDVRDKARHSATLAARAAAEVQEAEMALRGTHPPIAPSSPSRMKEVCHEFHMCLYMCLSNKTDVPSSWTSVSFHIRDRNR